MIILEVAPIMFYTSNYTNTDDILKHFFISRLVIV